MVIFGSSHVKRLDNFIIANPFLNNFRLQQFRITCHWISGGSINNQQDILEFEHLIQTHNPRFVVVHLGGGDLDQKNNTCVDVEEIILRWINILHLFSWRYSVTIAACQLLFRERIRHIDPVLYNNCVLKANKTTEGRISQVRQYYILEFKGQSSRNFLGRCAFKLEKWISQKQIRGYCISILMLQQGIMRTEKLNVQYVVS